MDQGEKFNAKRNINRLSQDIMIIWDGGKWHKLTYIHSNEVHIVSTIE